MAAVDQENVDAHFTVLLIASLVITLLFAYFSPRVRRALNLMSFAFFVGFLIIVAIKVQEILTEA